MSSFGSLQCSFSAEGFPQFEGGGKECQGFGLTQDYTQGDMYYTMGCKSSSSNWGYLVRVFSHGG